MSRLPRAPRTLAAGAAAVACLLLALAGPAGATIGPPVAVKLIGATGPAVAGEPYKGSLEIVADQPVTLSGIRLDGDGWQATALDAPATTDLAKSARLRVNFTAVPRDPDRPLVVTFAVGGRAFTQALDLSPAHYRLMKEGAPARPVPANARRLTPTPSAHKSLPPPALPPEIAATIRPAPTGAQVYTITVSGYWKYELPSGFWIGVDEMLVRVQDVRGLFPDQLAAGYTAENGHFTLSFPWDPYDGYPNLRVLFQSSSGHFDVRDLTYDDPYFWDSATWYGYTGNNLDIGEYSPLDESLMPVGHILMNMTRNWRWHAGYGYDCGFEVVYYPGGSAGNYHGADGVHIADPWHEGGYAHEYGHHWQTVFAVQPDHNYCNGQCDGTTCGHCGWCWENTPIPTMEGFCYWLGDVVPHALEAEYGVPINGVDNCESLQMCGGVYDDPNTTEGFFAALLRDIYDDDQDAHNVYGAWQDALIEGAHEIFGVIHNDNPMSATAFLAAMMARYPAVNRENLWETAANCGFDVDVTAPASVTNLHSTSHTVNVSSPDQTIDLSWTHATDDMSGIAGYGIVIAGSHGLPSAAQDLGKVTSYTTAALAPGTWYFSIRALDRSGNWSAGYAWSGPYIIRSPQPSNLEPFVSFGWTRPLVPREDNTAMGTNVPEPVTLVGNAASTWWNLNGLNSGESASGAFTARIYVDGSYSDYASWSNIAAGGNYMVTNDGPLTVRGGRHAFEVFHDALEQVAETDETDNRWAHQYVWTPLLLTTGTLTTRNAPPPYTAGWDAIVDGTTKYYNCDGLSLISSLYLDLTASWDAVYLYATDDAVDYDCRLHAHSGGATDGFAGSLATSARSAGYLDGVIVNGHAAGVGTRDVGVLNDSGGACSYRAMRLRAGSLALDDSVTAPLAEYEMMAMRRFDVAVADTGWYTISVSVDPPTQPLQVQYYLPTFTTGPLSTYDARASTSTGRALMHRHLTQTGRHGLAVYRDPRYGTDACTLTIEIGPTPPDFTPITASGWHAPFVPRPAADGTAALVALPDTLHGNANATWFNYCRENDSPAAWTWDGTHLANANAIIDGVTNLGGVGVTSFGAYQVQKYNQASARTVVGGRHTAAMVLDQLGYIPEIYEDNNAYGEQYCWSPLALAFATPVSRAAPPDRTGGWSQVYSGETRWYNCDGLRLPAGALESWRAVAVMPGAGADVDVRLHNALTGAKNGFASSLTNSAWGPGESDFVLVCAHNFFVLPAMTSAMDAGITLGSGTAAYSAEAVLATAATPTGDNMYGPYTLAAGHVMQLYSLWLTPGAWSIRLDNQSGGVDWGLSLYAPDGPFKGKSSTMTGGLAWLHGGGQDEWLSVNVTTAGWHALAVWKAGAADLAQSGSYRLRVHAGVTDTPDTPPARATTLVAIHPNPFNPQTRLVYDLAVAGPMRLEVYDLRGTRVRTLVAADQPAGRHDAIWDGRTDAGQQSASGVYMACLTADGTRQLRKMTLVK